MRHVEKGGPILQMDIAWAATPNPPPPFPQHSQEPLKLGYNKKMHSAITWRYGSFFKFPLWYMCMRMYNASVHFFVVGWLNIYVWDEVFLTNVVLINYGHDWWLNYQRVWWRNSWGDWRSLNRLEFMEYFCKNHIILS